MIKIFKNSVQQKKFKEMQAFAPFSWICAIDPNDQEIKRLNKKLKIPLDIIQDSLDEFELPRIHVGKGKVVVILRTIVKKNGVYKTVPVAIIITKENIITIAGEKTSFLDDFMKQKVSVFTTQKSNFLIHACLRIIYYYQKYIIEINRNIQSEKAGLRKIKKTDILRLVETEEILNNFIASLNPTINTIKKLMQHRAIELYQQDKELIDDLLIDGEQVLDLCRTNLKTVYNLRDGYATVMSVSLNQIMKVLTYITAIFTIPILMSGIYGMNIKLPLANQPFAFFIIMGVALMTMLFAVFMFIFFRKKL